MNILKKKSTQEDTKLVATSQHNSINWQSQG